MATVKKTNRGEYSNSNEQMDELLGSLADLILEIGADQPRMLQNNVARLERKKMEATNEATIRFIALCSVYEV